MRHEGLERLISSIERKSGRTIDALELPDGARIGWMTPATPS